MTIVLHVIRSSGPERHWIEAEGDVVHVPHLVLTSDDVVGFDVEVQETEGGRTRDDVRAVSSAGGTGDQTPGAMPWAPGVAPGFPSEPDPFFRLLDEMGWCTRPRDNPRSSEPD